MKRKSQLRFPVVDNTKGEKVRVVKRDIGLKHDIGLKYTIKIRIRGTKKKPRTNRTLVYTTTAVLPVPADWGR